MKVTASLNNLRIAPRKTKMIADLIRGLDTREALDQLAMTIRKPGLPFQKLLDSAIANAENNFGLDKDNLYITDVLVGAGPSLKRWMPRAYGRAGKILKRTSKITIVLDEKIEGKGRKSKEQMAKERQRFELEFDIRNYFRMGPVKYHSVIGIIPGTEHPDQLTIVSGHLDCFDVASGGVDDGTGASVTIEVARLIMKAGGKPKQSILCCLWAGEEFGLYGSTDWVKKNPDRLPKIANLFNRDGGPLVPDSISVSDAMWTDMKKICEPINSINPDFPFYVTHRIATPKPVGRGNTDDSPFAKAGVPTMYFHLSDSKGYGFNYGEIWHTERDMYNKSIPEYQEHTSIVTAVVAYGVANLDHFLSPKGYYAPDATAPAK